MNRKLMLVLGVGVVGLALLSVACGGSPPAQPTSPAAPTNVKHGSGQGGGKHNGGKAGEGIGNKDGHPGGTSTEHGSGKGAGRGGGKKAHAGDKNGKPGPQTPGAP